MKYTLGIFLVCIISSCPSFAQICENESEASKQQRAEFVNAYGEGARVTSTCRNDASSSHGREKGAVDFSTYGMSDRQAKNKAQNISDKTGEFCQYEKVHRSGKQTDYRYDEGEHYKTVKHHEKKEGVTGSHIHCQKSNRHD